MLLTQPYFYRRFGVVTISHLMAPVISSKDVLELPQNSIYHFTTFDNIEDGPPSDDYLFRNLKRPVMVGHITDLVGVEGAPRRQSVTVLTIIRDYHNEHRRTRVMHNLQMAAKDHQTLITYNYCLLNKFYRYVRSFYTEYYKWHNVIETVVSNIATVSSETDRHHYLISGIPTVLPSIHQLDLAAKEVSQLTLKTFNNKDSFFLLELWKWLSEDRKSSILSKIPNNKLHLVNIIFEDYNNWFVINLGVFNAYRKHDNSVKDYVLDYKQKLEPIQLQKRLLRMMMSMMEARIKNLSVDIKNSSENDDLTSIDKQNDTDLETNLNDETQLEEVDETTISTNVEINSNVATVPANTQEPDLHQIEEESHELLTERLLEEDARLNSELTQLNEIAKDRENELNVIEDSSVKDILQFKSATLEDGVMSVCNRLTEDGLLTPSQVNRFKRLANSYKEIVSQDGKTTLDKYIDISNEEISIAESPKIVDSETILDKTMLSCSLLALDSKYVTEILPRDTASMVMNIQQAGIAVVGHRVERVQDILGSYEHHAVKLVPVEGLPSTIRFKLPVVDKDGTFKANGVKYRLRKQRGDMPIRKTGPDRVALTSYYGKSFITRGRKKADDYGYWIQTQITEKGLNKEDNDIKDILPADVFNNTLSSPRVYSAISQNFKSFKCKGYSLIFDHSEMLSTYPAEDIKNLERMGNLIIGRNQLDSYLVLDKNGTVYTTELKEDKRVLKLFGTLEMFLNIPVHNCPVEFTELSVFGEEIPIGVILGYQMGLDKLMRLLKVTPRRVVAGARVNMEQHEYCLAFSDETLVFSKDDKFASLILAGFNSYHRALKAFSVYSFDKRGVYLNLLEVNNLGARYLRELDLLNKMFIDPITRELLVTMNEPVTFQGLMLRACEMLQDDKHPDAGATGIHVREKGYERLSGAVYTEIVQAVRAHNAKMGKANSPIELNPYSVWRRIVEDPSKMQIKETNPIESLKDIEAVTYSGTGGRNRRSMTKSTRVYHPEDMGIISESTVDSSDVAINIFTSADPKYNSIRGTHKPYNYKTDGVTSLLSTSALISAGADRDDPRRVNFIAIQQSHSIACEKYHQSSVKTGYEQVIPHRTTDLYAYTAKKPGTVTSMDETGVIVTYDDESIEGYEIGRRFGNSAGLIIPHDIVSPLRVGDKLEIGDVIVYNTGFFEPDFFNSKRVVLKNSMDATVVLWESSQTLEDASSISKRLSDKLSTKITKLKSIILKFDQSVSNLVTVGQSVTADTILCSIEDSVTSSSKLFNEQTLDTLKLIGSQTPRSGVKGIVERIEIFYHGDKEDMSSSLRAIANYGDRELKKRADSLGQKAYTGEVDSSYRIENEPLGLDSMAIRIYITYDVSAGVGDKGVFVHQLKTVFSEVLARDYMTEEGELIDAIFGQKSIADRIVSSPEIVGTTTVLLGVITKRAIEAYNK